MFGGAALYWKFLLLMGITTELRRTRRSEWTRDSKGSNLGEEKWVLQNGLKCIRCCINYAEIGGELLK